MTKPAESEYSDEFRELIRKRLAKDCTVVKDEKGEEHYVWKDTSKWRMHDVCLNKQSKQPYVWYFIQKNGYLPKYSMRKTCLCQGNCISHYVPIQKKRKLEEMQDVSFDSKTKEAEYCLAHLEDSSRDFEIKRLQKFMQPGENGCIIWNSFINPGGYGYIKFGCCNLMAHRVAWILANRKPIGDAVIRHLCGNSKCVNAHHLKPGTKAENEADKEQHATLVKGSKHPFAKIDEKTAASIFALKDFEPGVEIAKKFNVSQTVVTSIFCGRSWTHVTKLPKKKRVKQVHELKYDAAEFENLKKRISNNINVTEIDDFPTPHWIWKRKPTKTGYGKLNFKGHTLIAHRASWMSHNQKQLLPTEMVRHKCSHKLCVNPDHLEIGTAKDNAQDKIRDGTVTRTCKISENVAQQIKSSKGQGTQFERAKQFHVKVSTVSAIDTGRNWKHLK